MVNITDKVSNFKLIAHYCFLGLALRSLRRKYYHSGKWSGNKANMLIFSYFSQFTQIYYSLIPFSSQSGSNALHCAALNGHAGVIRVLVPMKSNPNQQRKDGWTPLHLACWNGHQDVVHELIVCKSQVNMRTNVSEIFCSCLHLFGVL